MLKFLFVIVGCGATVATTHEVVYRCTADPMQACPKFLMNTVIYHATLRRIRSHTTTITRTVPHRTPHFSRHLLMLAPGFRLGRGTEKVVANALAAPLEKPRVLVIPQWCIDPEPKSKAMPSLDIEDARRRAGEGTAGLCHERAKINEKGYQNVWLGAALAHEPDKNEAEVRNGRSLLRSDMINPVIVVDMWSAPALFLRHVEVRVLNARGVKVGEWGMFQSCML